jgi:hypothetical protein
MPKVYSAFRYIFVEIVIFGHEAIREEKMVSSPVFAKLANA